MLATAVDASWTLAPGPIALCAVLTGVYVARWRRVRESGSSRGAGGWRMAALLGGVLTVAAALISPLDSLAEQVFAMHMVQHVLLLDVGPILLILATTKVLLRPATPRLRALERAAGPLAHPAFAVAFYVLAMWVWHVPALYDAALEHPAVHVLEHVVFLSAGVLYWWHLLSPIRSREFRGLQPVVYMAATKILVGLLGILLTFAPDPLYAFYEGGPRFWGLSAEEDQALAGAIMAVEQSVVMGIALAFLFIRALGESDRDEERKVRYGG
jgi:cytochrome c oxidase assembly factor CtaG